MPRRKGSALVRALMFFLILFGAPVRACDVALVLTIDVSGSIDPDEYRLQMDGLADALVDPTVADALIEARARLAVVQWSGASRQEVTVPWMQIRSPDDLRTLSATVRSAVRPWRHFSTAIGDALSVAEALLEGQACARRVIDVSGDGASNEGVPPTIVRDRLAANGINVNALAILGAAEENLVEYYRDQVITGPRAFVYSATGYDDYPRAIRRKLLDEVTDPVS